MKTTINITYLSHSGSVILEDKDIGFSPFIGQIIENKFLEDTSCTGIFYVNKINTYKDTENSYMCDVEVFETNSIYLSDGDTLETVELYYKGEIK
jgi:hypothetical protein